jgi:hypothetical protein
MAWVIAVRVTAGLPSHKGERALHSSYADDILGAEYRMLVDHNRLLPLSQSWGVVVDVQDTAGGRRVASGWGATGHDSGPRWISAGSVAQPQRER